MQAERYDRLKVEVESLPYLTEYKKSLCYNAFIQNKIIIWKEKACTVKTQIFRLAMFISSTITISR